MPSKEQQSATIRHGVFDGRRGASTLDLYLWPWPLPAATTSTVRALRLLSERNPFHQRQNPAKTKGEHIQRTVGSNSCCCTRCSVAFKMLVQIHIVASQEERPKKKKGTKKKTMTTTTTTINTVIRRAGSRLVLF